MSLLTQTNEASEAREAIGNPGRVTVLTGSRTLNKRTLLFIRHLLTSGYAVQVLSLPRGRWNPEHSEVPLPPAEQSARRLSFEGTQGKKQPAAVFVFHWLMLPFAVLASWWHQVPLIYDEHDHYELNCRDGLRRGLMRFLLPRVVRVIHRLCLPFTSLVTCIHMADGILKYHLSSMAPRVLELHNYPCRIWSDTPRRPSSDDRLHFVYIGGLFTEKGVEHAIEAYENMAPELRSRCQLDLFGSGHQHVIDRAKAVPGVTLHGRKTPEELRHFASSHHCVGLVIYQDHPRYRLIGTNSRKLYEYLATGMPVIATAVGEIPEFLQTHGLGSTLSLPLCADELRRRMEEGAADPESLADQSDRARQLMQSREMTWEGQWERLARTHVLPLTDSRDSSNQSPFPSRAA